MHLLDLANFSGHNSEEVSREGPWKEEDWSGSSGKNQIVTHFEVLMFKHRC